jgi:hypothetical protein
MKKQIFLFFLFASNQPEITFTTKNITFDAPVTIKENFHQTATVTIDTAHFTNIIDINGTITNKELTVGNSSENTVVILYGLPLNSSPSFLLMIDSLTGTVYKQTTTAKRMISNPQINWNSISTNNINSFNKNILKIQNKNNNNKKVSFDFETNAVNIAAKNIFLNNILSESGTIIIEKPIQANSITCSEVITNDELINDKIKIFSNNKINFSITKNLTADPFSNNNFVITTKELTLKNISTIENFCVKNLPTVKNGKYKITFDNNGISYKTRDDLAKNLNFTNAMATSLACQNLNVTFEDGIYYYMKNLIIDFLNCKNNQNSNIVLQSKSILCDNINADILAVRRFYVMMNSLNTVFNNLTITPIKIPLPSI